MARSSMTQDDLDAYIARTGRRAHDQCERRRKTERAVMETLRHDEAHQDGIANENELQAKCERTLRNRGYKSLTAANAIEFAGQCKGWYGHMHEARRNSFMPDLWIIAGGRALLVELKRRNRYQPGQREMIAAGEWIECRTVAEFRAVLDEWEGESKKGGE